MADRDLEIDHTYLKWAKGSSLSRPHSYELTFALKVVIFPFLEEMD